MARSTPDGQHGSAAPPAEETRLALPTGEPPEGVAEDAWLEVIRKMDEVYSDLLQYEVALEDKNAALEDSQRFIFSVLTSMSDILAVCDRHGRIQQVNEAFARLVGKAEAVLQGMLISDLFADEVSRRQAQRFMAEMHRETLHDCEMQFRSADGSAMPVAVNCTPRLSPVGKFVGTVITGRPIGELRRAYLALRQAHEDLKRTQQQLVHSEKMASLGRLVAGVAHELNNPISFVLGNVHALQRYSQRLEEYLGAIHAGRPQNEIAELRQHLRIDRLMGDLKPLIEGTVEGAERTRDIVAGLKRFSAMDKAESEVFDLCEVIQRATYWVVKASATRLATELRLPDAAPVRGSAGQLQQVVVNLVQNAIDAAERTAQPRLDISGSVAGDRVSVSFHDNGPGFKPEQLSRVFDPFYTTKPVGKGTGLGLSISYGIVERHHGELHAANHPAGGAVLTLTLPLASPVPQGGSAEQHPRA